MTPGLHTALELARCAGWDWETCQPKLTPNAHLEVRVIHTTDLRLFRFFDDAAGLNKLLTILRGTYSGCLF